MVVAVYTWLVTFTRCGQNCKAMASFKLDLAVGRYCTLCFALLFSFVAEGRAQQKVTLREEHRDGDIYLVEASTEQTGVLDMITDPKQPNLPKRLSRTGKAKSQYVEKVLSVDGERLANKTIRQYLQLEA